MQVVLSIIGIVVASTVVLTTVLSANQSGYFSSTYPYIPSSTVTTAQWTTFPTEIGLRLFGAWVFFLESAIFLRKSYNAIGSEINVHTFNTAGLLCLIGAATAIIAVGFRILLVAQILTAVTFFSIPKRAPEISQPQTPPTITP